MKAATAPLQTVTPARTLQSQTGIKTENQNEIAQHSLMNKSIFFKQIFKLTVILMAKI